VGPLITKLIGAPGIEDSVLANFWMLSQAVRLRIKRQEIKFSLLFMLVLLIFSALLADFLILKQFNMLIPINIRLNNN
jgi:hypothetical protein